jgi:CBS domain-containing protein
MSSNIQDIMTQNPASCTPETQLRHVAQLMVENDCGSIPVVENTENLRLLGIVTDRDIVCRVVAQGKNPVDAPAQDAMSQPVVSVRPDSSVNDCIRLMEENQIRRIPVVDENGRLVGLVTQAQIARSANAQQVGKAVKTVSRKSKEPSRVAA